MAGGDWKRLGNKLNGSRRVWEARACSRVQNGVSLRKSRAAWRAGTARSGSKEGPRPLELPERAETPPEVAEGGRLEGHRSGAFFF